MLVVTPVSAQVAIELRTPDEADDFVCWTPVEGRVRLTGAGPGTANASLGVSLTAEGSPDSGMVAFQTAEARPTLATHKPQASISLTITAAWTRFWVSGQRPSVGSKDVQIVVRDSSGATLGALPVMVRVRKNADRLSDFEIGLFMAALAKLKARTVPESSYSNYWRLHGAAARLGIHKSPLFLPWHRAFLLDVERQLQDVDPRVTVPYWRYNLPSTRVFTSDFMGVTDVGSDFSPGGEIGRWADDELGRLVRDPGERPADGINSGLSADGLDARYLFYQPQLENRFHNPVHRSVGGWLASAFAPADPLFFLIHANVDRLWAHWQWKHRRFGPSDELSYSAQGVHPGSGPDAGYYPRGVYAKDTMWPWNGGAADAYWPVAQHSIKPGLSGTVDQPTTPESQLDYMGSHGGADLGYCYDDIGYTGIPIPGS